jgi:hypothetical protein
VVPVESGRKFRCQFPGIPVSSIVCIRNLINIVKSTGSFVGRKLDKKLRVLTE